MRCQRCRHLTRDPRTPGATLSGRGARSSRLIGGAAACQQAIGNQLVTEHGYRLVNAQSRTSAMAKRKQIESASGDPVANPDSAPQQGQTELPIGRLAFDLAGSIGRSQRTDGGGAAPSKPQRSTANIDNKEEPTDIAQATPARARWPQLHPASAPPASRHARRFGGDRRRRRRAGRRGDDRRILQARVGRRCRS